MATQLEESVPARKEANVFRYVALFVGDTFGQLINASRMVPHQCQAVVFVIWLARNMLLIRNDALRVVVTVPLRQHRSSSVADRLVKFRGHREATKTTTKVASALT